MDNSKELNRLIKLKQKYAKQGNTAKLSNAIKEIGDIYYENGHFDDALQEYSEQLDLCKNLDNKLDSSIAHRMIGECYINTGNFSEASRHLKQYLEGAVDLKNLIEEQRAYATLGRLYFVQAERAPEEQKKFILNRAIDAYSKSIVCCDKLDEKKSLPAKEIASMKARLLLNFGLVKENENIKESCTWMLKAVELCLQFNLVEELNQTYIALASIKDKSGDAEQSLYYFQKAANTPVVSLKSNALLGKSELLLKLGNWREARQILVSLYKMKGINSDVQECVEKLLKTVVFIMRQEDQLKAEPDRADQINMYEKLGDLAVQVLCYTKAINYYEKMLEYCEKTNSPRVGEALISLARTLQDVQRDEEAIPYAKRELELNSNDSDCCSSALFLAELQIAAQKPEEEIEKSFDIAMVHARMANKTHLIRSVLKARLKYYEKVGMKKKFEVVEDELNLLEGEEKSSDEETESEKEAEELDVDLDQLSDLEEKDKPAERQTAKRRTSNKIKRNEKGETPLHVACIAGNIGQVEKLLDENHPINVFDNAGWTPLHEAANHGYTEIAKLLIKRGANVNDPGGPSLLGMTPLHDACTNGAYDIIRLLVKYGADLTVLYKDECTPYDCLVDWKKRVQKETTFTEEEEKEYSQMLKLIDPGFEHRHSCKTKTKRPEPRRFRDILIGDEMDDELMDEFCESESSVPKKKSAAEDYRSAIESVKHKSAVLQPLTKNEDKAPLLDVEDCLIGEWMEDDLGTYTKSSKREPTFKRKSSTESIHENVDRLKRQKRSEEVQHVESDDSDEIFNDIPFPTTQNASQHKTSKKQPKFKQTSLDLKTAQQKELRQATQTEQLDNFGLQKEVNLRVLVDDRIYFANTSFSQSNDRTVETVTEIVAKQFRDETGCIVRVSLLSSDDFEISKDEKLSRITNDGQITEFFGKIVELTVLPVRQRYSMICSSSQIDVREPILNILESCEKQSDFQVNPDEVTEDELLPFLKTVMYQPNVRSLCLSGFSLFNLGQQVNETLKRLTNLTSLILENCDITNVCLSKLNYLPRRLKVLKVSNNPLGVKCQPKLVSLLSSLKELNTLELRYCDLRSVNFSVLPDSLVNLDVSGNFLDELTLENLTQKFFIDLNVSYSVQEYSSFSIVRQVLINDSRLLSFTLESLDISSCKLRDSDVDIILNNTGKLRRIHVNNNAHLTKVTLERLLSFAPSLEHIGMVGCQIVDQPPSSEIVIDDPSNCSLVVSMLSNVIVSWETLWRGTCVANELGKNLVEFKPC